MYFAETVTEVVEERLAYDGLSLVGDVGGATGLLLGWSLLGIAKEMLATLLRTK